MSTDRNGLEILGREECLYLLTRRSIGRVGVSIAALPVVLPVNFVLFDGDIVIRTGEGTKLDAALCHSVVAFEVDDFDPVYHTGWSVLVRGRAREVRHPAEVARVRSLPLQPWAGDLPDRFIRISADLVSGRRITRDAKPLASDVLTSVGNGHNGRQT